MKQSSCKKILWHVSVPVICSFFLLFVNGCKSHEEPVIDTDTNARFEQLTSKVTGIEFTNSLSYDDDFNIFTYRNYYNGGGVALGDINNDGLTDVFFTANMLPNRLFLNKGNFKFEDITDKAGITKKSKWSTGVSMADVNGDGYIDIYVCNSGDVKGDNKENELFINNGNNTFSERGAEFGLNSKGFSTHAAFFDFDKDGDLDMFLLNNSFRAIGSFDLKMNEREKRDSLGGHKFFRNDNNHFVDISDVAGIYGSVIGFGLGITVGDLNNDGWQDMYVSNDFFERDYLYINNKNGTFSEVLEKEMQSISNASMGADMADINNDSYPEIFVTEMLPDDEGRIKMNTTFENWDKYQLNLRFGYYHQFTRNMLQLNNRNGTFSDIGRYAGVHATDWSWGALIADLDNDGYKDIFVSNGIYQDLTNEDFIQYISNREVMTDIISNKGKKGYRKLIDLMPSEALSNYAFHNNGDLTFTDAASSWGLDTKSFSNGSAYGDLDNDGDLDLVVNNVNMPCFVYRNRSRELHPEDHFLRVSFEGEGKNRYGIGSKVTVYSGDKLFYQEQMPMRGFQSTVDARLNFGLGKVGKIDSVVVEWNDGKAQTLTNVSPDTVLLLKQKEAVIKPAKPSGTIAAVFKRDDNNYGIDFVHKENDFVDFNRDKLIFRMLSTEGPRMAKGDVNGDGLEDVYICGARGQAGALYVQERGGRFTKTNEQLLEADKESEDTDAIFFDADGDGDQDLFVCSGGNEFSANSTQLISRLYINEGRGNLKKSPQILPSAMVFESAGCVSAGDYDGDGDQDLFVGVRLKPFAYGYPGKGYILENNGRGMFKDVTEKVCAPLVKAGMVTDAEWYDYDGDHKKDLVVVGEYMPVRVFRNTGRTLEEITDAVGLGKSNGWWNRVVARDVNGDGRADLVLGNHGENSRFRCSADKPVEMWVSDFDHNGSIEQVVSCYNGDSSYPMALRHDLVNVLPYLKKKYLKYAAYERQGVKDIFTADQLKEATRLVAYELRSCVMLNDGKGVYEKKPLPMEAQLSVMYGLSVEDYDGDGKEDILMGGNFYESKPEVGIYDGSYGLLLKGDGKGNFRSIPADSSGINIRGAIRDIIALKSGRVIFALNNQMPVLFDYPKKK